MKKSGCYASMLCFLDPMHFLETRCTCWTPVALMVLVPKLFPPSVLVHGSQASILKSQQSSILQSLFKVAIPTPGVGESFWDRLGIIMYYLGVIFNNFGVYFGYDRMVEGYRYSTASLAHSPENCFHVDIAQLTACNELALLHRQPVASLTFLEWSSPQQPVRNAAMQGKLSMAAGSKIRVLINR